MLLQPARLEMAFLKSGFFGEAGSGKTFTSSLVAIGLHQLIKAKKPIAFIDSETGSDFVLSKFKAAKINLLVAKTRSFNDLIMVLDEAEKDCSILVIDSITHFWVEIVNAYLKKNSLSRMTLRHWQPVKAMWSEFTNRFIGSKLHIIMCGRSADKWDEIEDPEDGSKEMRKVGTKMRTEGQTAYEPSLLVEMEAIQLSARTGGAYIHRAYIKKDRFDVINGKIFDDPTFDSFLPHISLLNLGGEHKALEPGRDSTAMFERNDVGARKMETREILIEKIGNEIKLIYPGQTEGDKTARINLMKQIFQTSSWTEICTRRKNEELQAGLDAIIAFTGKVGGASVTDEKKSKIWSYRKGGK